MTARPFVAVLIAACLTGCATWTITNPEAQTAGDPQRARNFGYQPIDSLPVTIKPANATSQRRLDSLPDETMRLAVGTYDANAGVSFGPAILGVEGSNYVVILDYMKFTTKSFAVKKTATSDPRKSLVTATSGSNADVVVPVYVGVGLRLTANITVRKGRVDLGNLFAIGAAAEAQQIYGTLVIQSLGLSGETVSPLIPIPSEINATTIQNALQAIGAVKAKMYDGKMNVVPRVIGVYNNLGGGQDTINGFISTILEKPIELDVQ